MQEATQLKTVDFEHKLLWLWYQLALTGSVPSESTLAFCIFITQNKNMIPLKLVETLSNYTFCNIWYYVLSIDIQVANKTIIKHLYCFTCQVWGRTSTRLDSLLFMLSFCEWMGKISASLVLKNRSKLQKRKRQLSLRQLTLNINCYDFDTNWL
jgi:hypothetical protein